MARPIDINFAPADPDADGVAQSQTPGGAGDLTINGALASNGVATMDIPRRVSITSAADDSGRAFTVYGRDRNANAIQEDVTGANAGAAETTLDFKTVTRVAVDAATAGAVTVGTSDTLSGPWIPVDRFGDAEITLRGVVTGTINWGVQQSYEPETPTDLGNQYNPAAPYNPPTVDHDTLSGETTSQTGVVSDRPYAIRFVINSFSSGAALRTQVNRYRPRR